MLESSKFEDVAVSFVASDPAVTSLHGNLANRVLANRVLANRVLTQGTTIHVGRPQWVA